MSFVKSKNINGELVNGVWKFPVIVSDSKTGKREWRIEVGARLNGNEVAISQDMLNNKNIVGLEGWYRTANKIGDGEWHLNKRATIIKSGKNIGKSNYTTPLTQALSEAFSKWTKKHKTNTAMLTSADIKANCYNGKLAISPMLVGEYNNSRFQKTGKLPYGDSVFIQKKFNGVRCIAYYNTELKRVELASRRGEPYLLKYIMEELDEFYKDLHNIFGERVYLDGELYNHGEILQSINSYARVYKEGVTPKLTYHIYDVYKFGSNMRFGERWEKLMQCKLRGYMEFAKTTKLIQSDNLRSEIDKLYNRALAENYEGVIIRFDMPYEVGVRSNNLLKYKPFYDAEFKVVGWKLSDVGITEGAVILQCETKDGKRFDVNVAKTIEERIAIGKEFANGNFYLEGKEVIVKYNDMSKDGIPLQATTEMLVREGF